VKKPVARLCVEQVLGKQKALRLHRRIVGNRCSHGNAVDYADHYDQVKQIQIATCDSSGSLIYGKVGRRDFSFEFAGTWEDEGNFVWTVLALMFCMPRKFSKLVKRYKGCLVWEEDNIWAEE